MKRILSLAVACSAAVPAYAEDWRLVGDNVDQPAIVAFVDHDSIKRSGSDADFVLIYYLEGETAETDLGVRQQRRTRCPGSSFQILSERNWIGTTEQPASAKDLAWRSAISGSIDEAANAMICGTRAYASEKIEDPDAFAKDFFEDLAEEADW